MHQNEIRLALSDRHDVIKEICGEVRDDDDDDDDDEDEDDCSCGDGEDSSQSICSNTF